MEQTLAVEANRDAAHFGLKGAASDWAFFEGVWCLRQPFTPPRSRSTLNSCHPLQNACQLGWMAHTACLRVGVLLFFCASRVCKNRSPVPITVQPLISPIHCKILNNLIRVFYPYI